ncbi:hypothetical protein IWW38_005150, partial [Coemansia aciculifera]
SPVDGGNGGGQSPAFDGRQSARYSPPRRTSYPHVQYQQQQQQQQHRVLQSQQQHMAASRAGRGSYHTFRYYPPLSANAVVSASASASVSGSGGGGGAATSQRIHSWAPSTSSTPAAVAGSIPEEPVSGGGGGSRPGLPVASSSASPKEPQFPASHTGDPDETCQQVLDILAQQMRRISAEQSNLARLKESTQSTMDRVEQILQMYNRRPPLPDE